MYENKKDLGVTYFMILTRVNSVEGPPNVRLI